MLPRVGSTSISTDTVLPEGEPMSFASLRKLQLRKKAVAVEMKSKGGEITSGALLTAQLKAQQIEIRFLKKERESMSKQLQCFKSLPTQIEEFTTKGLSSDAASRETVEKLEQGFQELMAWKSQQWSNAQIEEKIEQAIAKHNIDAKLAKQLNDTRVERQRTEKRVTDRLNDELEKLTNRVDEEHKTIASLSSGFHALDKFKEEIITYIGPARQAFELSNNTSLVERMSKQGIVIGQVKKFQSDLGRLFNDTKKLTTDQDILFDEREKLASRVAVLEESSKNSGVLEKSSLNNLGPGFKKAGTPVSDVSAQAALQRLDQVDKDIKALKQFSSKIGEFSSQIARVDSQAKTLNEQAEKLKTIETHSAQLSNRVTTTEGQMSSLGSIEEICNLPTSFTQLQARLADVEARSDGTPVQANNSNADVAKLSSQIQGLEESLTAVDSALGEAEKAIHDHDSRLEIVEKAVPELFKENFDPFKKFTTDKLLAVEQSVARLDDAVANSKQQPQRTQSPAERNTVTLDPKLRQEVTLLQTTMLSAKQHIARLQQELPHKADKIVTDQRMDQFTQIFKILQDQYNNITTDELHSRMVQWFLQNYPSNAATMLQRYGSLQEEVNALKDLSASVGWVQSRSEDIASLLTSAPQLQELLNSATELRLPQLMAKINEAYNESKQALTVAKGAQSKAESHTNLITSLQQSLHNLNAVPSSSTQATQTLDRQLRELRKDLETGLSTARDDRVAAINKVTSERKDAINEVRNSAGNDHELRVKEMKTLKASLTSCNTAFEGLSTQVTSLQETSEILRTDVNTINNDYIVPNRNMFGLFSHVLIVVCQLQTLLESVNMNLPKGPIEFEWHMNLNDVGPDGISNGDTDKGKGKGKGKQ